MVGRPFTGLCTATISSGLSGAIRLEWRDEEGMVIASSNGTSSAEVAFVIDNFMMANSTVLGGYTCSADITAENGTRRYSISLERGILFTCKICPKTCTCSVVILTIFYSHSFVDQYNLSWRLYCWVSIPADLYSDGRYNGPCHHVVWPTRNAWLQHGQGPSWRHYSHGGHVLSKSFLPFSLSRAGWHIHMYEHCHRSTNRSTNPVPGRYRLYHLMLYRIHWWYFTFLRSKHYYH